MSYFGSEMDCQKGAYVRLKSPLYLYIRTGLRSVVPMTTAKPCSARVMFEWFLPTFVVIPVYVIQVLPL